MKKILLAGVLLLASCAGTTNIHGSLVKPADVDKLRIGVHDKQQVMRILGTPSTVSTLNGEKWYYITDITVTEPLQKPSLKERQIIGLVFTQDGILDRVFDKDETVAKNFSPESTTTQTQGEKLGVGEQIYLNLTSGLN
ncbi:MAG: Outer membrane protein assembly factor BamE [Proteobacteria bacterium]|jgi:outer membrane protein assembly factor BamE (lipoprotein component of BamABCDE complex)|nr:MAG: Outer membrane protein assembly factor BamE [Pseudomonadota bacterium]|tara:strand:- start:61 stop:477 length:417 start_codon:yes stop_codon:yes gene_type:complete